MARSTRSVQQHGSRHRTRQHDRSTWTRARSTAELHGGQAVLTQQSCTEGHGSMTEALGQGCGVHSTAARRTGSADPKLQASTYKHLQLGRPITDASAREQCDCKTVKAADRLWTQPSTHWQHCLRHLHRQPSHLHGLLHGLIQEIVWD
eukprot:1161754-Pelagomonas_calceolata.AAC.2